MPNNMVGDHVDLARSRHEFEKWVLNLDNLLVELCLWADDTNHDEVEEMVMKLQMAMRKAGI